MSKWYALLQNWHFTSIDSPSLTMSSRSFLLSVAIARETRSLEQSHWNAASTVSLISSPNSPRISSKISSGVFPSSSISVTEAISVIFFSRRSTTSSGVNGISWMINPPACLTDRSGFTRTPSPTADGTCSEVANSTSDPPQSHRSAARSVPRTAPLIPCP